MSIKRNSSPTGRATAGDGAKVERQDLFDKLKKLAELNQVFTPVDVSLAIGAGEPQVSRALLGLAAEGVLEKVELGRYRALPQILELTMPEFLKMFARASKTDTTRQRDLSEIQRLKQNNDTLRARLLQTIAERDHYLNVLREHAIDPGQVPAAAVATAAAPVEAAGDAQSEGN